MKITFIIIFLISTIMINEFVFSQPELETILHKDEFIEFPSKGMYLEYYNGLNFDLNNISLTHIRFNRINNTFNHTYGIQVLVTNEFVHFFYNQPDTMVAVGLNIINSIKYSFVSSNSTSLYFDFEIGAMINSNNIPPYGGNFNLNGKIGVGTLVNFFDELSFIIGGRYMYLQGFKKPIETGKNYYTSIGVYGGFLFD